MRKSRRLAYEPERAAGGAPALLGAHAAFQLADVAKLAAPNDNAFIATRNLAAGAVLRRTGGEEDIKLTCEVLEGHRFARGVIPSGALLTSWHQPFGKALCPIAPGEWLRNAKTITELKTRRAVAALPSHANFADYVLEAPTLAEGTFRPGEQMPLSADAADFSFDGFKRSLPRRGVGTRNFVVVLCVSSRSNALARAVEASFRATGTADAHVDGVVALPHTEVSRFLFYT